MGVKTKCTPANAMEINTLIFNSSYGQTAEHIRSQTRITLRQIYHHAHILEKHGLIEPRTNKYRFTADGFTAYVNIIAGNPD